MSEETFKYKTSPIAEMQGGIVLARFEKPERRVEEYQTESQLEENMINNLVSQGYERLDVRSMDDLYSNLRVQIEKLNDVKFSDSEWKRFLLEYLDAPNDGIIEKTRKIQENHIYDFVFDDGRLRNIKIIDKKNIHNNHLQVVNQVTVAKNRYDVSILVNGLPLVHIELKKRGVNIREAFNQIQRYEDESFNLDNSLYKFVQIFVISNGTYTRYFANTTERDKSNYEFTCEWADAKNRVIADLEDFTATFFEKRTILEILTKYCVFNSRNVLLIMRPYQIAATERLLWRINSSFENKKAGSVEAGGFIWHTTGSGKTLTSFKSARLATELDYIDKVFFVVDRKDLDYQTMREYQKFQKDSVNGSKDTKELKISIEKQDNKIVVTTIQKLNEFVKSNKGHEIYNKHCVFIYDECHRSQFGLAQKNIQSSFKHYYQFGFTGTPILVENSIDGETTTASVFGAQLHSYVITDAIRDGKVLKFKIDYNSINPKFKSSEEETDDEKLKALENKMFLHPERISEITNYILDKFDSKTYRNTQYTVKDKRINGFNAMFAVQSVDAAKMYYEEFKKQQANLSEDKKLKVATIFSYAPNEERASGEIEEESMTSSAMSTTAKQFLTNVVDDYNSFFQTNFTIDGNGFENYYKDLSSRVRNKEVDLLIVVGMFLTGFDAPTMNTLFVDKNLRYHGLIQAFSRTNRILNKMKAFGNIVCFRNLEKATKDAIKLFGDENSINVIIERSYDDYINGFTDEDTGVIFKGYKELCEEIIEKFPDPTEIKLEKDKKEFVKLFGEILKRENILRNYDEFSSFEKIISERLKQDMKSVYIWIKDESISPKPPIIDPDGPIIDYSDVEFHIDLLKTEEVNLDYILALILEKAKEQGTNNEILKEEIRRLIRSSLGTRAKEELIIEFINRTDLTKFDKNEDILEAFYEYAKIEKEQKINELITEENLKEKSKKFIEKSISRGYVAQGGTELDDVLPPVRRVGGEREAKKQSVLSKLKDIVKVFVGI
ncbi:type I restriction endonuclease subunit R [Gemella haemolysans]|uniref:Type I restriction enzyme endonuclease subunit n=1 Tax=Gemella haemolysans ATCC 10379 TaxID=546270 RepID=C5NUT4_9BACL|nr:type I restriction endonuclease subunit R [Gemella haemolysans]EER69013.1 type I site-specific deoxyribonuclease, HsdR family [Gemella haemolysans ATCC 10379]KAA8708057.1 type I restriction endonuclease subunit R [Gemella haemolysans]UBH82031.1 type I restriction endonuclease subunit R [Gemella haemolysans]VEI38052.1 Type I restriction enzyme EcoR124II R protein [Gemella haemolysans]